MTKTKPDCSNYEAWQGYMEVRKIKKFPITARAIVTLVNRLLRFMQEGQDITLMLDQSTVAGWNTVYPVKGYVRHEEKPVQKRKKAVTSPEIEAKRLIYRNLCTTRINFHSDIDKAAHQERITVAKQALYKAKQAASCTKLGDLL
ncbi:MAG: hypothetical protein ACUZ8I_10335 [Candidatus Scalindua sp.]